MQRACRLAWPILRGWGSRDPGSNPGRPTRALLQRILETLSGLTSGVSDVSDRLPEAERLASEISRHSELYYNFAEPEISDSEFDALVEKLRKLDPNHPQLKAVGADPPPDQ